MQIADSSDADDGRGTRLLAGGHWTDHLPVRDVQFPAHTRVEWVLVAAELQDRSPIADRISWASHSAWALLRMPLPSDRCDQPPSLPRSRNRASPRARRRS